MTVVVDAAPLRRLAADIFTAAGCPAEEGARIAKYLVEANLTGHDSHGVIRIPRYVHWLEQGLVRPGQSIEVAVDSGALAVVDGRHGFGQTVGEQAVDLGIEKAKAHGLAVVGLRNSGHLGRVGDWPERAAAARLVSVHFVNTTGLGMLVAPFGARERRMSTNPFAVGVPCGDGPPLIVDFATSVVAEGKILVAVNGGKPLPEGALVDADGTLTTDPEVIYGKLGGTQPLDARAGPGAIRAMGEHKGSGLSIMCELLAGALTGGGCARPGVRELVNAMLSIYIDPVRLDAEGGFVAEIRRYVAFARSARPIDPNGKVMMPGDPENAQRAERGRAGIPLQPSTWDSIAATARALGIDPEGAAAAAQ
jgi:uncharacterized oxidoreductase